MKLVPQTRSSELTDKLNSVLHRAIFADRNSFEMRALKRECEQVRDVDPAVGWGLLGSYNGLLGDIEEAARCYKASLALANNPIVHLNYYAAMGNLGYFSMAHDYFLEVSKPELGNLSSLISNAESMGSFQTIVQRVEQAEAMNLQPKLQLNGSFLKAVRVLRKVDLSDEFVVRHLDAVGDVLREAKMFADGDMEVDACDIDGVFVGVTCIFRVDGTALEVFELNQQLAKAERVRSIEKHLAFDVMFKPAA